VCGSFLTFSFSHDDASINYSLFVVLSWE
jgi:hypothetical protein